MKKLFIFDLDNTLTESRTPIAGDMADLISKLLEKGNVAVISGAKFAQFQEQFLSGFRSSENFARLFILPTSGAELWRLDGSAWQRVYQEKIPDTIRRKVIAEIARLADIPKAEEKVFIDDRGGQVTYSALGVHFADMKKKKAYDPDEKKRRDFVAKIAPHFPELSFHIGGTTSIDVTTQGVDKGFGISKLLKHINVSAADAVFVGDALYEGGNDEAAESSDVAVVATSGPQETKRIISGFLKNI